MKLFGGKRKSRRTTSHSNSVHNKNELPVQQTADDEEAKPESGKKHRLSGLQRGLLLLLASIVVLVGVVVCVYKALVRPPDRSAPVRTDSSSGTEDGSESTKKPFVYTDDDGNEVEAQFSAPGSLVDGRYNILLIGTDKNGMLTDTIMIAHMDAVDHEVALMSVPRDTLIYGNYSVPKINSVYGGAGGGAKGIEALRQMIASMLGFEVDGYVLVDLQAFVDIINLIGGVYFNVPQRMYYSDPGQNLYIDLYPGEQTLTGEMAMGLVRYRATYTAGDIKRTEVQQDFMVALAKQLLSFKTVTKLQPIVETCIEYVDTDLTLGNILYFVQELFQCDISDMETVTLPGDGTVSINGLSYYSLYPKQVLEIVNEYFNPYDSEILLSSLHIRTASGSTGSSSSSSGSSSSSNSSGNSGTVSTVPDDPVEVDPDDPSGTEILDPDHGGNTNNEDTPGTTDPGATDPGTDEPGTDEPGTSEPGETDPGTTDPGVTDPGTTNPGTDEPGTTDPGTTDPGQSDPGTSETLPPAPTEPDDGSSNGSGILDPTTAGTGQDTASVPATTPAA